MRAWLLHIGEQLPVDGATRPFRYGYLACALQDAGHEVLRWAPTFCHVTKTQRYSGDNRVAIDRNYHIQFVHSPGYERNTSFARLRTYQVLGRRFRELAKLESRPDVIVAAIPSLEWANEAVNYGRANNVPVVVDVRDLWPDVFPSAMPLGLRSLSRMALAPYSRLASSACRRADALAAVSDTYLTWGLKHAGRAKTARDAVFPLGYQPRTPNQQDLQHQRDALVARGIDLTRPVCFFAGALERHHDLVTVIDAAKLLNERGLSEPQFVICGDGSHTPMLRQRAAHLRNVHLLGWVDSPTLEAVASISVIGLCAYAKGALMSIGNKPYEYMAGSLAIVSCLPGELANLLSRHECGMTYRAGDPGSLAQCLSQLLTAPHELCRMRDNAQRTWSKHYCSREVYARFVEHLGRLTVSKARAA